MKGSDIEVADIVRRHGDVYLKGHGRRTSWQQRRVLLDIARCRTSAMGGHVDVCRECGLERNAYNSCRNRHCPKCLGSLRRRWATAREAELLPVPYFHLVFTLPPGIAMLALTNPRIVYDALFKAAAETLTAVAADPAHLGAQIGFVAVLHTWGQKLDHHPHVHCIVPGGGLSPDGQRWVSSPADFFLPVRVLSRVFRGKCIAILERELRAGRLQHRAGRRVLGRRLAHARRHEWIVYAKPPFGGAVQAVRYLARYTHRVAIANHRITAIDDDHVAFLYKDYADDNRTKTLSLTPDAFLGRFLLHVLPPGFTRIRHYGFLANRGRKARLQLCRELLAETPLPVDAPSAPAEAPADQVDDDAAVRCPACHQSAMQVLRCYPRPFLPPLIPRVPILAWDTS